MQEVKLGSAACISGDEAAERIV